MLPMKKAPPYTQNRTALAFSPVCGLVQTLRVRQSSLMGRPTCSKPDKMAFETGLVEFPSMAAAAGAPDGQSLKSASALATNRPLENYFSTKLTLPGRK